MSGGGAGGGGEGLAGSIKNKEEVGERDKDSIHS